MMGSIRRLHNVKSNQNMMQKELNVSLWAMIKIKMKPRVTTKKLKHILKCINGKLNESIVKNFALIFNADVTLFEIGNCNYVCIGN